MPKIPNIDYIIGHAEGVLSKYEILFAANLTLLIALVGLIIGGKIYYEFKEKSFLKKIEDSEKRLESKIELSSDKMLQKIGKDIEHLKNGVIYAQIKGHIFSFDGMGNYASRIDVASQIATLLAEAPIIDDRFTLAIINTLKELLEIPISSAKERKRAYETIVEDLSSVIKDKTKFIVPSDAKKYDGLLKELQNFLETLK